MKVVFFVAGGEIALRSIEAVGETHEIAAVVRPRPTGSTVRRLLRRTAQAMRMRPRDAVRHFTTEKRIPTIEAESGRDKAIVAMLNEIQPDVICIATFPWILDPTLLTVPSYGAFNLHASLLPRHRGPNPYFWTYYHDDRDVGVTVHVAANDADAGEIVIQDKWELRRGFNVIPLHAEMAVRGAAALREAVDMVESGERHFTPQDETLATKAPRVKPMASMVNFAEWDVERVWHFLAGIHPFFHEPLRDAGRPVRYGTVIGYERTDSTAQAGRLERMGEEWRLQCLGGSVRLTLRDKLKKKASA